ncbi:MAG: flavin reductase family protein [Oscillospiraceae bacterium]
MSKINWNGSVLLAPVPAAMVSCGDMDKPNILTIAWTGIICSNPPRLYISVKPQRFSHDLIKSTKTFVVNLTSRQLLKSADWCGVKSGSDTDKFKETGLSCVASPVLGIPMIDESPLSLECRVYDILELGSHDMFLADIVGVSADETLLDHSGKLCLDRAELIAYSHGEYFALGEKLGTFGFSVMKKKTVKRKLKDENKTKKMGAPRA